MNLFKQWYKSLYSPKDIVKTRFQTIGKTILYIFFLSLLSVIPTTIYSSIEIKETLRDLKNASIITLPDFTIENGELITAINKPEKYVNNSTVILFDPTDSWTTENLFEYNKGYGFFTKEFVYYSNGSSKTFPYDILNDLTVTKGSLIKYLQTAYELLPIIIALFSLTTFLFAACIKFIEVSIFALFGLSLCRLLGKQLPYRRLWGVSAYSITLALTFLTVMSAAKITVIFSYFVYWIFTLIVLFLALREIPGKK